MNLLAACDVYELALKLADDIVTSYYSLVLFSAKESFRYNLLRIRAITDEAEPNSNYALYYKIHFRDILLFIINEFILWCVLKPPWHESKGNILKKLGFFH